MRIYSFIKNSSGQPVQRETNANHSFELALNKNVAKKGKVNSNSEVKMNNNNKNEELIFFNFLFIIAWNLHWNCLFPLYFRIYFLSFFHREGRKWWEERNGMGKSPEPDSTHIICNQAQHVKPLGHSSAAFLELSKAHNINSETK